MLSFALLAQMRDPWILLIPVVIAVFAAFELRNGVSRFGRHVEAERDSNPAFFWGLIGGKFVLVGFLLITYFTKYVT